ncbi:hypothetical protein PTTG_25504 [Puccinia triticina 1-1 BBBD Race 1]|uniref:Uncharacterized protein n=2 Tax=Puccinia triticina TaxID=208348 RepID=A0A180H2E6_PUCT1|nr:uncharacterized protein PtA15_5A600 [Puccinia triticina]OAV98779.1 hypothetical protein PTTG_25504 [Puccinia triticina 1-1 BBBD Race 1]WAQ85026.1 hypothetical protein PtA15_5A600 [Puccinia triticina]WAR58362.1 hypothetical protein PtB15_5B596 [Puccinia triticina]
MANVCLHFHKIQRRSDVFLTLDPLPLAAKTGLCLQKLEPQRNKHYPRRTTRQNPQLSVCPEQHGHWRINGGGLLDFYIRLGNKFNDASLASTNEGISMSNCNSVSDNVRTCLKAAICKKPALLPLTRASVLSLLVREERGNGEKGKAQKEEVCGSEAGDKRGECQITSNSDSFRFASNTTSNSDSFRFASNTTPSLATLYIQSLANKLLGLENDKLFQPGKLLILIHSFIFCINKVRGQTTIAQSTAPLVPSYYYYPSPYQLLSQKQASLVDLPQFSAPVLSSG